MENAKIYLAAAGSWVVSLANVNEFVQVLIGLSVLGYTITKWRRAARKKL